MDRVHTLILGAGYAGLMCAARLAGRTRGEPKATLMAPHRSFSERLRLHERLASALNPPSRAVEIVPFLQSVRASFVEGAAISIDRAARRVAYLDAQGSPAVLEYVRLVIACGSGNELRRTPGAQEHAFRMERNVPRGSEDLRSRLQSLSKGAHRFIVVGAGATGIEVAGELAQIRGAKTTLIGAGRFGDFTTVPVARLMRRQLTALGVELIENVQVTEIGSDHVMLAERRLASDLTVWCGGFRVPALAADAGLAVDEQGRVLADPWLRSVSDRSIYAAGDACMPTYITGAPPRMSAFFALTTGAYVADALTAEHRRRPIKSFSFATYGQAIQIGRGGVGFATFPFDRAVGPIYRGRLASALRRFFIRVLLLLILLMRSVPAAPFWLPAPGVRRVQRPGREPRGSP